jgi:hypothetical protein
MGQNLIFGTHNGVHDDGEPPGERDPHLRRVDRLAMANAQSFSFRGCL